MNWWDSSDRVSSVQVLPPSAVCKPEFFCHLVYNPRDQEGFDSLRTIVVSMYSEHWLVFFQSRAGWTRFNSRCAAERPWQVPSWHSTVTSQRVAWPESVICQMTAIKNSQSSWLLTGWYGGDNLTIDGSRLVVFTSGVIVDIYRSSKVGSRLFQHPMEYIRDNLQCMVILSPAEAGTILPCFW